MHNLLLGVESPFSYSKPPFGNYVEFSELISFKCLRLTKKYSFRIVIRYTVPSRIATKRGTGRSIAVREAEAKSKKKE